MPGQRTAELFAGDLEHSWHPFTQMRDYAATEPLLVDSADGNWVVDSDGRRLFDATAALWCNVHGHRVPEIDAAITSQLGRVAHTTMLGSGSVPAVELATALARVSPGGLERVFFAENGASAVEIAIKMAFQHWQLRGESRRTRFLSFENAYHGDTLGAVSVGGIDLFHETFRPLLFDVLRAPSPTYYRCPDAHRDGEACGEHCLHRVDELLTSHSGEVCAVIIEPVVQGAGGMITQPKGFLASLAAMCRRHDVLLILDEVATGFGRTGTLFACEQEGVSPDLMVIGKGLTAGYLPMSAVLATESIYASFLGDATSGRTFFHGHTYTGNQLACSAALANLDIFQTRPVLEQARERALHLASALELIAELPCVGEVRQRGLMVGIELVADRASKRPFDPRARAAWNACLRMRRRGVLARPLGDVVVVMPPLSVTPEEVDLVASALGQELSGITV